jgi:hypothetical protein
LLQFQQRECDLDYKTDNFRRISHVGQKVAERAGWRFFSSIFSKMVRRRSGYSGQSGRLRTAFKQNKSASPHHPLQNDLDTRG